MAYVVDTAGAWVDRNNGKGPQHYNRGQANSYPTSKPTSTTSSSSSGSSASTSAPAASYNPYADYLAQLQELFARQQAAAAEAERKKQEAAQKAYDRNMAALDTAYKNQISTLKGNYDSALNQLQGNHDQGAAGVNLNADNAQQQAYINYMMGKRDLPQQMTAQGLSGGAAESTLAGMYNSYGNSRNAIDTDRNQNLADLLHSLNNSKESALQAYNGQIADAEASRLAYQMQLEQNLAAAIADAATANYDQQFQLSSNYLAQMNDLQSKMASAAQKAASTGYTANNVNTSVSTSQGGGVTDWSKTVAAQRAKDLILSGGSVDDVITDLGSLGLNSTSIAQILQSMGL